MGKAEVLMNMQLDLSERFRVELRAFKVKPSIKFPQGIKVRFVLLDKIQKVPRLLVDNHAPYGFHVHEKLPENPTHRRVLGTNSHLDAQNEFWKLVKEILKHET